MKVARFMGQDGKPSLGIIRGDRIIDLGFYWQTVSRRVGLPVPEDRASLVQMLKTGWFAPDVLKTMEQTLDEIELGAAHDRVSSLKMLPPVEPDREIFCVARNFARHAVERGVDIPEHPVLFMKPRASVIAHRQPILLRKDMGQVDHEAEVAAVIGKTLSNASEEEAKAGICGYTCLNDITARSLQKNLQARSWPWLIAKGMDTFCPVGPWLVTADEFGDFQGHCVICRVNGEIRQEGGLTEMLFSPWQVASYLSRYLTLYPGDIIALGTPEGIGPILPGDTVEVEVSGIGILCNPVEEIH